VNDYVWHFVLVRDGQAVARGERLATFSLPAEHVARVGLGEVRRAVEAERTRWARAVIADGYVDGWGVSVVSERGYRRTIFPAAAAAAIAPAPRPAILLPEGVRRA
jgi:hypothetical protein